MVECCGKDSSDSDAEAPRRPAGSCSSSSAAGPELGGVSAHFDNMICNCLDYARAAKQAGRPVVGIMCEFTPRELIMAAGAVPVCLCGGSAEMIPPAEEYLPVNLCPLIKSTFGYHVEKANPFLEMADLIVAETTCDGKKKMYELMAESRPMHVLELPQKPDDPDALQHWITQVRGLKRKLEELFQVDITDDMLRQAIGVMNTDRHLRRRLAELMKRDPPPLTGRDLLKLKSTIAGIPADLEQYEKAFETLLARDADAALSPRVRVLLTGVPIVHGAEKVVDIIEGCGGLIVCSENCSGLKPLLIDIDAEAADPLEEIAREYFNLPCSVMTKNDRRLDYLRELAVEYRPQCVIELIWQACLTYDVESARVRKLTENELGIPYLRIETDYSPSDAPRIAVRVEALLETVRANFRP